MVYYSILNNLHLETMENEPFIIEPWIWIIGSALKKFLEKD
jgi:hypothetical protein